MEKTRVVSLVPPDLRITARAFARVRGELAYTRGSELACKRDGELACKRDGGLASEREGIREGPSARGEMRKQQSVLIDVRPDVEWRISRLSESVSLPMTRLQREGGLEGVLDPGAPVEQVYVICRRGNDSQIAVARIQEILSGWPGWQGVVVTDVVGGYTSWARDVDPEFPIY